MWSPSYNNLVGKTEYLEDPRIESISRPFSSKSISQLNSFSFHRVFLSLLGVFSLSLPSLCLGELLLKVQWCVNQMGQVQWCVQFHKSAGMGSAAFYTPSKMCIEITFSLALCQEQSLNHCSGSRSALEVILGVLREFQTHKYYCFRCLHCFFLAVSMASSGISAHLQFIYGQCLS